MDNTQTLIFWLIVFIVTAVVEGFSFQLISIWFSIGSVAAFCVSLAGLNFWWQLVVFALVSVITLLATRPLVKRLRKNSPTIATNADKLIGSTGVVITKINNLAAQGRVLIDGLDWNARSFDDNTVIDCDTKVEVIKINGVTIIVKPKN